MVWTHFELVWEEAVLIAENHLLGYKLVDYVGINLMSCSILSLRQKFRQIKIAIDKREKLTCNWKDRIR